MVSMVPLITQLVVDGLISRPQTALPVRKSDVALGAVMAFGFAAAGVCGLLAFYFYMIDLALTPALAALATAGLGLGISFLACAVMMLTRHLRRRDARPAAAASLLPAGMDDILGAMGDELEDVIAKNPATATALSALAGFVVAEKMNA